ncbi:MAG: transporter [Arcobacteraceae bacterium]|nr:transporter [Arcobacteraceae bacterium]
MKKLFIVSYTSSLFLYGAVNDIVPSDYEAPLVDTTSMSVNYLSKRLKTNNLPNNYVSQNTYAVRYTRGINLNDKTLALSVAIPYTNLTSHGTTLPSYVGKESKGMSDIIFSASYWFVNNRKNKDFLATTMTLAIPNGKYDQTQLLNSGENRYKSTVNLGYISKISNDFIIELSPEIAFYGDANTKNGKLKQKPSYAINSNLRYKPNTKFELFGGFQQNYQSETTVNNIEKNDDCFYQKYSFGGAYYTDKFHQIMVKFAKENDKEFGFQGSNEILLRYRWWFK